MISANTAVSHKFVTEAFLFVMLSFNIYLFIYLFSAD